MATGAPAVARWIENRLKAELRKRGQELCANADKVYAALKDKGAAVPSTSKWNGLSCDQKIAFIVALGPYGTAMLAAGALVAGWTSNAAGLFKAYGETAAKSLGSSAKSFADSVGGSVSSGASSVAKRIGIGGVNMAGAPERPRGEITMRRAMDVDFGYLGNFGAISSGGGTQARGNLGGLGGPAGPGPGTGEAANYARTYAPDFLNAAVNLFTAYVPPPRTQTPRAPSPVAAQSVPAPSASSPRGGASMPSWALPAAGLVVVGGLLYALTRR